MKALVDTQEWYPVLSIQELDGSMCSNSQHHYEIPEDLYTRYLANITAFSAIQAELDALTPLPK